MTSGARRGKEEGIDGECRRILADRSVECRGDVRRYAWLIAGPRLFLDAARSGKFNAACAHASEAGEWKVEGRRIYKGRWMKTKEEGEGEERTDGAVRGEGVNQDGTTEASPGRAESRGLRSWKSGPDSFSTRPAEL